MLIGVAKAGVLKETWPGETRVALVPGVLGALAKAGIEVPRTPLATTALSAVSSAIAR